MKRRAFYMCPSPSRRSFGSQIDRGDALLCFAGWVLFGINQKPRSRRQP